MSPSIIHSHANGSSSSPKKHQHQGGFATRAIHVVLNRAQDAVGVHKGFEYTRSLNPNRAALERTLAAIESGGAYALTFSSGSATTGTVLQSLGPNAHIVSVNDVYGGTFRYMTRVAKELQGLETTFVDLENASDEEVINAIRPNTKLIWIESPTNPTLRLIDIEKISKLARSHPSRPLILVDNTFLSPFYSSPLLLGADLVMHSMTKYINGHSDVLMGALILPASPRHLAVYEKLQFLQNASGAVPSAYDCWLAQRGAKTLHLRMKAHGENALAVAKSLQQQTEFVEEVIYPGLKTHPRNKLAYKSLSTHARKFVDTFKPEDADASSMDSDGYTPFDFPYSGMISFRIRGSAETAEKFLTSTKLFTLAESLGGVESLAEHPAQMTHGSIPPAERAILGIGDNLIRLSVGVEDGEDLVEDVAQALRKAVLGDDL